MVKRILLSVPGQGVRKAFGSREEKKEKRKKKATKGELIPSRNILVDRPVRNPFAGKPRNPFV